MVCDFLINVTDKKRNFGHTFPAPFSSILTKGIVELTTGCLRTPQGLPVASPFPLSTTYETLLTYEKVRVRAFSCVISATASMSLCSQDLQIGVRPAPFWRGSGSSWTPFPYPDCE